MNDQIINIIDGEKKGESKIVVRIHVGRNLVIYFCRNITSRRYIIIFAKMMLKK